MVTLYFAMLIIITPLFSNVLPGIRCLMQLSISPHPRRSYAIAWATGGPTLDFGGTTLGAATLDLGGTTNALEDLGGTTQGGTFHRGGTTLGGTRTALALGG